LLAIIDVADYEWLRKYTWRATGTSAGHYAYCTIRGRQVLMHRLIMNPPPGMVVDHINGNKQDNRRSNLRVCTQAENLRNSRKHHGTSRFKGVSWYSKLRKWEAKICRNGETTHLGWFKDEVEAAKAYDRAAVRLFGQFTRLNFPKATNIVWLSGRIDAHNSHAQGRIASVVRRHMPTRSTNMAPGARQSEHGRGIRPQMQGTSPPGPDVSTTLRSAQRDKNRGLDDAGTTWRLKRRRAFAMSRGPPGRLMNHALEALG
jgi:hypothetical protein